MACLGVKNYDPAVAVSKALTSASVMAAFDTSNLRITFTATGTRVRVRIKCVCVSGGSSFPVILLGVLESATIKLRMSPTGGQPQVAAATAYSPQEILGVVDSLTAGTSYTWDAAFGSESTVGTTAIKYGGPNNNTTANDAWGALQFEIWEA